MSNRLTLFTATLVQDSALSVSGVDRESAADLPFALVNGVPTLAGTGLKGAAVAMARRFFDPLPRSISEDPDRAAAYRRSAWEFANATPEAQPQMLSLRAGVGICYKTGARAKGVLYDREILPSATRWPVIFRVDWSQASSPEEAEGILGYVLSQHWAQGRCWLGGGVARGLGWCHLENLKAYRLNSDAYETWVQSGRDTLPEPLPAIPIVEPTRSWSFHTLNLKLSFGEYQPDGESCWGLDMLAIAPHATQRALQPLGDGLWAKPSWTSGSQDAPEQLQTDRALIMDGVRPLMPGSSLRGAMRHAFTRTRNASGENLQDPHSVQGAVEDAGGEIFGTTSKSSRILMRDGRAGEGWAAARLHMHAEDEFSAGSYESSKRDAVRLLRAEFPMQIVVEGPDSDSVEVLTREIDSLVALGELGHLPVGGDKTRGAGWDQWKAGSWIRIDIQPTRSWQQPAETPQQRTSGSGPRSELTRRTQSEAGFVKVASGETASESLAGAAEEARRRFGRRELVAWWCDPAIDFDVREKPVVYGVAWPEEVEMRLDEAVFFATDASWRVAKTASGFRWVLIEEVEPSTEGTIAVTIHHTPAWLDSMLPKQAIPKGVVLREWHSETGILGFTLERGEN